VVPSARRVPTVADRPVAGRPGILGGRGGEGRRAHESGCRAVLGRRRV